MGDTKKLLELFNEKAPIAQLFGMKLSFDDQKNARIHLPYNPNLDHALGLVHGGIYATMLDNAGWFTVAGHNENNNFWIATTEMSIHFLLPAKQTELVAIGKIIKLGKRQSIAEMSLFDGNDNLVGHSTGTFMQLSNVAM
ncbi:PaaI family thioesterase [Candidatus Uabimicrobium helgolandensis]